MKDYYKQLYKTRFADKERAQKSKLWEVLCKYYLQRYISTDSAVLDIATGYGDFIDHIRAKEKYAIDLNRDSVNFLQPDVKFHNVSARQLSFLADNTIDVVFMSNFLEHLDSKSEILGTFKEIKRVCKPGGKVIIIQPNIKYAYREYWDFFDHNIPLSDKSVSEGLRLAGFEIEKVIPKFLPFTTKSYFPKFVFFLRLYLVLPLFWRIFGKQMFVVAKKG